MKSISDFKKELRKRGNLARAKASAGYFKTGKGEYGEGDVFLGVSCPNQRNIAKMFLHFSFSELEQLLNSPIHEHRFSALEVLVMQYERGNQVRKEEIAKFYVRHAERMNNWDLVDTSAPYILGDFLLPRNKKILYHFARSKNVWTRRIAIISTGAFIREGKFTDTLAIAVLLLHDTHDLIHKAVGWMLREVGKRSPVAEEVFLKEYAHKMSRTMLRSAIERFPKEKRRSYLRLGRGVK